MRGHEHALSRHLRHAGQSPGLDHKVNKELMKLARTCHSLPEATTMTTTTL